MAEDFDIEALLEAPYNNVSTILINDVLTIQSECILLSFLLLVLKETLPEIKQDFLWYIYYLTCKM